MFYSSLWLRSNWRKILDVLGEEKKSERKKEERKTSSHSKEREGGRERNVCMRGCVREREKRERNRKREGEVELAPYLYSTFVKVANKGVILSSCSILVQYSLAQSTAISARKMRDRGQVMCNEREYVEYGNRSACIMMHSLSFRYLYFLAFSRAFHAISLYNSVCACVCVSHGAIMYWLRCARYKYYVRRVKYSVERRN